MGKQVIALLSVVIASIVHFLAECEFAMQQFYPIVQLILNFIIEQGCFDEENNFIGKKELYLSFMLSSEDRLKSKKTNAKLLTSELTILQIYRSSVTDQ